MKEIDLVKIYMKFMNYHIIIYIRQSLSQRNHNNCCETTIYIQVIREWIQRNFLKLNDAKRVVPGHWQQQTILVTNHTIQIGEEMITMSTSALIVQSLIAK